MIPIKFYIYAALAVAFAGLLLYERQHLINEGKAQEQVAVAQATEEQRKKDDEAGKAAVGGLNEEIARLRTLSDVPPRVLIYPCTLSAKRSSPGTVNSAPTGGSVPVMPEGDTGNGIDLGPGLLFLAQAGDIVSARNRADVKYLSR